MKFADVPGARIEIATDPSGTGDFSLDESVTDGVRTVTVGKKGRDYPLILGIALVIYRMA